MGIVIVMSNNKIMVTLLVFFLLFGSLHGFSQEIFFDQNYSDDEIFYFDLDHDFSVGDMLIPHLSSVFVKNNTSHIQVTCPLNNDIFRAGDVLNITGNVSGEHLYRYQIVYGEGLDPTSWDNAGISLSNDGFDQIVNGTLASWDTSHITDSNFFTLRVQARFWKNSFVALFQPWFERVSFLNDLDFLLDALTLSQSVDVTNVYFDTSLKEGWPIRIPHDYIDDGPKQGHFFWPGTVMPLVSDVNDDEMKEVFVLQQAYPWSKLYGFEADGCSISGWPVEITYDAEDPVNWVFSTLVNPTIANMDEDIYPEFVCSVFDGMKILEHTGLLKLNFSYHVCTQPNVEVPVVDLDGDGSVELIKMHEIDEGDGKYISVLHEDGMVVGDWPQLYYNVRCPYGVYIAGSLYEAVPVVGDFDEDDDLEIVVACNRNVFDDELEDPWEYWESRHVESRVIVYNIDGSIVDGFPVDLAGWTFCNPVVGDINRDGLDEIVVGTRYSGKLGLSDEVYGLFVLDRFGDCCEGWPQLIGEGLGIGTYPSLADFDGDGFLEIITGTMDEGSLGGHRVFVFDFLGDVLEGWPVETQWYSYGVSATIGDITGDGVCDIVLPRGDGVFPGFEGLGGVYAWEADGSLINGFPKITEVSPGASISIIDLDNDGFVDLVGSSHNDCAGFMLTPEDEWDYKYRSSVYVWELDVPFVKESMQWPMFQHDLCYSGHFGFDD